MASKNSSIGFNVASFVNGSEENKNLSVKQEIDVVETSPRKRSKKNELMVQDQDAVIPVPQTSMSYIQENIPYQVAYNETNQQLNQAIQQLDMLGREMMADIQMVRASKTLKNKYITIRDMTGNAVGIISAKIAAIKEKNKTIDNINNLEIRRIKELKMSSNEEDDNTRIANLYHAFVNMPMSQGPSILAPAAQDIMMGAPSIADIPRVTIGADDTLAWQQNLDAAQRRMLLQSQGKLEIAVMYDEATGNRSYIARDPNTGAQIPDVELPDPSSLYELTINLRGMFAKDDNRNTTYPLIVINGGNGSIMQY